MPVAAPIEPSDAPARRPGQWRFSAAQLLVTLVLLIVVSPFAADFPGGTEIEAALMTIVLLSAVFAVADKRRTLVLAAILAAPAVIGRWLHHLHPEWFPHVAFQIAALVFVGFVIVNLLHFVLRAPRVNGEVLCASISAYLMLGLLWAFAYAIVAIWRPGAFTFGSTGSPDLSMAGTNAFYFSFVTLSTVGYGDIVPVSPVARMLAVVEAMTGLLYVAVLIARLVSMYSTQRPDSEKLD
jgi:voltage-gated potassium channel